MAAGRSARDSSSEVIAVRPDGGRDESNARRSEDARGRYKKLLFMCAMPPSGIAGMSIIARQMFLGYDPDALHVLCCSRWYEIGQKMASSSYLACRHTTVRDLGVRVRPHRYTVPLSEDLNCLRTPWIVALARRIVRAEGIEAIFTVPWTPDFALAALLLHRLTGLPLYVYEMDDWEGHLDWHPASLLIRRYHRDVLRAAKDLWLISPSMVEAYRDRFGVEGRFLCQAVDLAAYQRAAAGAPSPGTGAEIKLVYTGSVNRMFRSTLKFVCDLVNAGIEIGGRRVRLEIYTHGEHRDLAGRWVSFPGLVPASEIPDRLATADALLMPVSFEAGAEQLVRTSLYTKTIDYLASGRPMLMVAPAYSAVARYCGDQAPLKDTAVLVDRLDRADVEAALARIFSAHEETAERCARGVELVRRYHDVAAIDDQFLRYFRTTD